MAKFKTKDAEGNEIEVDIELSADQIPQDIQDQIIKRAQGVSYGNIDSVAKEKGFEKKEGEKTSDFIARVLDEQKSAYEELKKSSEKGGEPNAELEAIKTSLEDQKRINEGLKTKLTEAENNFREFKQTSVFDAELSGLEIAVPEHIIDENEARRYKQAQLELIKSGIKSKYKISDTEDGKYRIQEGNEAVLNDKNELASLRDVAQKDYSSWMAVKKEEGQGTGGQGKPKNDGRGDSAPKTFEDITAMAAEKNLSIGSSDWTDFVNRTAKEHSVDV